MTFCGPEMSIPLSLNPRKSQDDRFDSVREILKRIHEQYGQIRNVTETGLEEEIRAIESGKSQEDGDIMEVEMEGHSHDREARRKELMAAKAEMLQYVAQAQNEALTALDSISLLLTRNAPRQGELSMSPLLKQLVPTGTLGYDKIPNSKRDKTQEQRDKAISIGWNLQNLDFAANTIQEAAERLKKESDKEAVFWDQILSIKKKGWPLCRMPREKHTIGVRFGFSEASPTFHSRGLAALRPDADGNIVLDRGLSASPKRVRVQFFEHEQLVGVSSLMEPIDVDQAPIETVIRQARDSLFEEELFHEIGREAQHLLPYGIQTSNDQIRIPFRAEQSGLPNQQPQKYILIDLVSLENADLGQRHSVFADLIAVFLRIMLTDIYRKRFRDRTRPPPPISEEKRSVPIFPMLRPLLHYQHHSSRVIWI